MFMQCFQGTIVRDGRLVGVLPVTTALKARRTKATVSLLSSLQCDASAPILPVTDPNSPTALRSSLDTGGGVGRVILKIR